MISSLASPSVCVIDDDQNEFPRILEALYGLRVGCIHFLGDTMDQLPETGQPLKGLRLVFTDLYLSSGAVGKDMASHTANVFRRIVSPDTAPILVVIWSKHVDEPMSALGEFQDDQLTEADLFIQTLLEAEPKFSGRLIFTQMRKPYEAERPEDWASVLRTQMEETLQGQDAIHALWTWESLVRDAALDVSAGLTSLSKPTVLKAGEMPKSDLKEVLQLLVHAQGESDLSASTAPRHLASVLSQLLEDQLDHSTGIEKLLSHGNWLSERVNDGVGDMMAPQLNSFLLTMASPTTTSAFMPGTVYAVIDDANFKKLFGVKVGDLTYQTFAKRQHLEAKKLANHEAIDSRLLKFALRKFAAKRRPLKTRYNRFTRHQEWFDNPVKCRKTSSLIEIKHPSKEAERQKVIDKNDLKRWREKAKPVLIEVSPACDVAQGVRRSALLIAGLILPSEMLVNLKKGDAFQVLPTFSLRCEMNGFPQQDVFLVFCSRYKVTLPATDVPEWLKPWFRLRELPTAALRNWHAGHASRVGYVSL